MKDNYIIVSFGKDEQLYNAWSKAPSDMIRFVCEMGGRYLALPYIHENHFSRLFKIPGYLVKLALSAESHASLVFVFPEHVQHKTALMILRILKPWFRVRKVRLVAIVSDVEFFRYDCDPEWDIKCLNLFDKAIVHSPAMASVVKENGYLGETTIHNLYDYHVAVPSSIRRHFGYDICFAGNLKKSVFLEEMVNLGLTKSHFVLYGNGMTEALEKENVSYKGKFSPDDLSSIEGDWGLVWDGDSALGLSGHLGRYLKINSPHKASMYLCAGLPVIAPEGSFAAEIVSRYGLGLVIKSIADMDEAIGSVNEEDYARMLCNVKEYAERLTSGRNLADSLF